MAALYVKVWQRGKCVFLPIGLMQIPPADVPFEVNMRSRVINTVVFLALFSLGVTVGGDQF